MLLVWWGSKPMSRRVGSQQCHICSNLYRRQGHLCQKYVLYYFKTYLKTASYWKYTILIAGISRNVDGSVYLQRYCVDFEEDKKRALEHDGTTLVQNECVEYTVANGPGKGAKVTACYCEENFCNAARTTNRGLPVIIACLISALHLMFNWTVFKTVPSF